MKRPFNKTDSKAYLEKGEDGSNKPMHPMSPDNVLPTTTSTHPIALASLAGRVKIVYWKGMEVGGNWGCWIHKISFQKYIKLLILFQNLCCIYFKLPWEYQRGHSCSLVGEWDGMGRKPISLCAGSTPNSFLMPFWLSSGLTLFQHSENSGHSPRLPGQVYGSFLEGICDLSSWSVGCGSFLTPSGDITTRPRWRNACLNKRKMEYLGSASSPVLRQQTQVK